MSDSTSIHTRLENKGPTLPLPAIGSWPASAHQLDTNQLHAIKAAELAERPLLIRGEPGLGKSQIARAVAAAMQWRLVTTVVNARTEIDDLLYSFDYIERLSEGNRGMEVGTLSRYIRKGPVWRALSNDKTDYSDRDSPKNENDAGYYTPANGCVLLIDEIDKAHPDIPNALLEVLNAGSFDVPATDQIVGDGSTGNRFIVITSNRERTLPAAFLRRCATLHLELGSEPEKRLQAISTAHRDSGLLPEIDDAICEEAARLIVNYRDELSGDEYRPGTSEYLDLLRAISKDLQHGELKTDQVSERLESMSHYLVKKSHRIDSLI